MQSGNTINLSAHRAERRGAALYGVENRLPDAPLEPGARLDRYLILNRLGGGAMGLVYRARDTELDREVALKVLARPYCQQTEMLQRFRAEAQAQARLRSPHVVTLYSLLELPVASVLVLEYVEGETLEHRLRTRGPLPALEAIAIFDQALRGLAHVHEMGVLHRDLKPGNLFVTATGLVKIIDFSVAKVLDQDIYPTGAMVGTLLYISPEQIRAQPVDERSDIYTLGVSLYETVTGRLPFERPTEYGLMHAHVQEAPPNPRTLAPALPPSLERVILRSIEKDPDRRFRSALEFRAALLKLGLIPNVPLEAVLPANAYGPAPRPLAPRRSGQRVFAGFALDLLLVFVAAALLYALGVYPGRHAAPAAGPVASAAQTSTATPPSRARPKPINPTPPPPAPKRDPYDSLRDAWGR
jgi:eukaryotic-like serine/threonine-protein kinase